MNKKARVTLRDIAHQANVSVSTVSRALNNHEYVDKTTRQAIYHVADQLGYPLDKLRTVPSASPYKVVLLSRIPEEITTSSNDFEFLASEGVRKELEDRGIQVSVQRLGVDGNNIQNAIKASGIIWMGGVVDQDFIHEAHNRQIPLVLLGGHALPTRANCVMADYVHGMIDAVNHLLAKGRKHIGLVNGPPTTSTSAEKTNGLILAHCHHNLPFSANQIVGSTDGWFDVETGYRKTFELLNQFSEVDAIIYAGDNMAMGGLTALKETGRRIPDDISVIGFHNYEISRFTDPALTTVSFDMRLMGQKAAQRLCAMIEQGNDTCWTILAPTELIVRNST